MQLYKYHGDKLTDQKHKGKVCTLPKRANGKCFRGKNGNMLADFNGELVNIIGRCLRKV
jgi:hypothetical protein